MPRTRTVLDPAAEEDVALAAFLDKFARRHRLSVRERAVLAMGVRGVHRKQSADWLGCSPGTVDTYWNRILRKVRLSSQLEVLATLVRLAVASPPRRRSYRRSGQDSRSATV